MPVKHVPQRMCVACRARRPKRELLRIVLTEGGPVLDPSGRRPGRGAYVCPDNPECWAEKKLRRFAGAGAGVLSRALQTLLEPQDIGSTNPSDLTAQKARGG
ncbi:YlxR family protein [Allomeiothermus silvanus]|uniref:YlxR family protein n=1 Tax=Allomeiothermus silvanus TaxID=52022 RepID=UPI0023F4504E|nr:YlxR family protein [Allomeiothermus silvanus]